MPDDVVDALPPVQTMPEGAFVEGWKRLVGEPPAIMLADRRLMIALLVGAGLVAPEPDPDRLHEAVLEARSAAPRLPGTGPIR